MPAAASLSPVEAKELGRALRFIRQARGYSLRDAAAPARISPQYLQNIERGERTGTSLAIYERLGRVYDLPNGAIEDLLLKARILSALEDRGVTHPHAVAVWSQVETLLNTLRYSTNTDLAQLVASIIG